MKEEKSRSHTGELIDCEVTWTSEQLFEWKEEGEPSPTVWRKISHLAASLRQLVRDLARATLVPMASDASHMLEAALEQMDDIITGKRFWFIIVVSKLPTTRLWRFKGIRLWQMRKHPMKKERERENAEHVFLFVFFLNWLMI